MQISRTGTLRIDAPPHHAFPLFSGPGEKLWVNGWEPTVLSGDGWEKGSVFETDIGEKTTWIVIEFDREAMHACYARFAPNTRVGTVDVTVTDDGNGGSVATVRYDLTALSDEGRDMLAGVTEEEFANEMVAWENAIRAAEITYPVD